jgi:hypothetical protein
LAISSEPWLRLVLVYLYSGRIVADSPAVVAVDLVERREVMRVPVGVSPDGVGYHP